MLGGLWRHSVAGVREFGGKLEGVVGRYEVLRI